MIWPGGVDIFRSSVMPKKSGAILEEIPDNQDVQAEDHQNLPRETGVRNVAAHDQLVMVDQLEYFDRNKKSRFANGHPASPRNAEHQANAFDEREEAIKESAGGEPAGVFGFDVVQAVADIREKPIFRIEMNETHKAIKDIPKSLISHVVNAEGQQKREGAFQQLDRDDEIKRWRALFLN